MTDSSRQAETESPTPSDAEKRDGRQLVFVGYAFLVWGGLFAMVALVCAVMVFATVGDPDAPGRAIQIATLVVATFAALNIFGGIGMIRRRWRAVSLAAAGVNLVFFPFGTLFGALGLVVLFKPGAARLY
jgi:1-acyl-sn-glycerol-3-phosphate acyltransferase